MDNLRYESLMLRRLRQSTVVDDTVSAECRQRLLEALDEYAEALNAFVEARCRSGVVVRGAAEEAASGRGTKGRNDG